MKNEPITQEAAQLRWKMTTHADFEYWRREWTTQAYNLLWINDLQEELKNGKQEVTSFYTQHVWQKEKSMCS